MRVLHLFANWKWTGPAEIAVNVARGLAALGTDARFACGRTPPGEPVPTSVAGRAAARGVAPVLSEMTLGKHARFFANWRDARLLRAYLDAERIDLVHAHLANDHSIARRAIGKDPRVRLVRTSYDGEAMTETLRLRRAMALTDAAIFASQETRADAARRFAFPLDRAFVVESPIDLARFDAERDPGLRARGRERLGIAPDAFAVGIVARMQTHRNFDVFLEGIRRARAAAPGLRAVVIGRGTNQEVVAKAPARAMGLGDVVAFPGYLDGEEYISALAALDVKIFLVPGSDGSCRAVREALAMGLPVLAARRGMLPEIVKDGVTGAIFADGDPAALADAIIALARDPAARARMAAAAREDARARFSLERTARDVQAVYDAALARPRRFQPEGAPSQGRGAAV